MRKIIDKHVRNTERRSITTLSPIEVKQKKRISIPFYSFITNKIKKVCKRNDIKLVTSSSGWRINLNRRKIPSWRTTNQEYMRYNVEREILATSILARHDDPYWLDLRSIFHIQTTITFSNHHWPNMWAQILNCWSVLTIITN
jgi:hypothetical protein